MKHPPSAHRIALSGAHRALSRPLEVRDRAAVADAIVVVGSPLDDEGRLTAVGAERVLAGVHLWQRRLAPILCLSGGGPGRVDADSPREADAMAQLAGSLGIAEQHLRIERESISTADNALRSAELLAPEGVKRIWVVSQPFHTRRCRYWFRKVGFEVLCWSDEDSVQYKNPGRGITWVTREYAAWVRTLSRELRDRLSP